MKKIILSLLFLFISTMTLSAQEMIKPDVEGDQTEIAYFKDLTAWKVIKDVKQENANLTSEESARVSFVCGSNYYAGSAAGQATYLGASGTYYTVYFEYHAGFNGGSATNGYVSGYYTYSVVSTSYNPC